MDISVDFRNVDFLLFGEIYHTHVYGAIVTKNKSGYSIVGHPVCSVDPADRWMRDQHFPWVQADLMDNLTHHSLISSS